jgi:hypothetical protein
MTLEIDEDFEKIYDNLSIVLNTTLVRYTEAYKLFNARFSKDWDKKVCFARKGFNLLLSEINATIKLHNTVHALSNDDYIETILQNFEESKRKIENQVRAVARHLKNINADNIL